MFVLDNSVTMCWLFNDGSAEDLAYAESVLTRLNSAQAVVPSLWGLEVANVLFRAESKGFLTEARSQTFVSKLGCLAISVDHETAEHALQETLGLARRYKLSSYDASYLELALRSGAPLATLDKELSKAAQLAGVYLR